MNETEPVVTAEIDNNIELYIHPYTLGFKSTEITFILMIDPDFTVFPAACDSDDS